MADKKISALPAASTPLAGTEVLPIVQGGTTDKVSVANLTAGRAVDALSVATTTGVKNTSAGSDIASPSDGVFLTDAAGKNVVVQLGASGQLSTFVFESGGAGWRRVAALLPNGNSVVDVGNFVVGTAGKGIADSSGNLKLAITTTSVAASSVLSGGLTHRLGTYSAGETTPSVTGVSHLDIANASPTTITNFTGAVRGQMLLLLFRDGNTTITRANAYLAGAVDFTSANRATLLLMSDGSFWYEVCRSTTNG